MNEKPAGSTDSAPVLSAEIEMSVPFYDLDPLGVVWHGNYYKYFEAARAALMRLIDFDIEQMRQSGYVWPVSKSDCTYISPLRYDMKIKVKAELEEDAHRLGLRYTITEKETGKILAKGHTQQVAVQGETWEMCLVTPDVLLKRLSDARQKLKP